MEQRSETISPAGVAERARRQVRARAGALRRASLPPAPDARRVPVTRIEAEAPRARLEFRELWRARDLALTFAWRDVKVRYKQSLVGIAWAILQPLMTMIVFTVIFGKFANFPSEGTQYQVFVYAGLLPWMFFSTGLTQIASSVVLNRQLVQKIYFPRLILPLSGVLVPAIDFLFALTIMFGIAAWYHTAIQWTTIALAPFFLLLLALAAVGVGAFFATINVRYRDVPYAMPFLIQIWLYLSPVIYGFTALPHKWKVLFAFNPVVLGITGFRWALLGTPQPSQLQVVCGLATTCVFVFGGLWVYRKWESSFADVI